MMPDKIDDLNETFGSRDSYQDDFYGSPNKNHSLDSLTGYDGGDRERGAIFRKNHGRYKHKQLQHLDDDNDEHKQHNDRKAKKLKRQRRKQEKAALMLQMAWRCRFARVVAKRVRRRNLFALAAQSGVLLACEGTKQGETGWYQQNEDRLVFKSALNQAPKAANTRNKRSQYSCLLRGG